MRVAEDTATTMTDRTRNTLWMPSRGTGRRGPFPPSARSWLLDTGSLTARLKSLGTTALRVQVLAEAWQRPGRSEVSVLQIAHGRVAWIREVLLVSGDRPWVFARTVMPSSSLRGGCRRLRRLGGRPLGSVFLDRSRVRRGPLEVARITPEDGAYRRAAVHVEPGRWARRSILYIQERPVLVTEVFLPALAAHWRSRVEEVQ